MYPLLPDTGQRLVLLRPHLCIHVLIKLGRHICKDKTLVKKNMLKRKSILMISHAEEINTYSFFLQYQDFVGRKRMGRDQDYRRQGSAVPIFNRQGVLYGLFNTLPIPTLELRPSLYCAKQETRSQ